MGRMAELWEEQRQELDEWENDPIAQLEYQQWCEEQDASWERRYPAEREPVDCGLQPTGEEHGFCCEE